MKSLKTSLWSKVLLSVSAIAMSLSIANADVKEGTDYVVLKEEIPNAQNTVIEVYSYACPFCYKYSKFIPEIIKNLPKGVTFKPYHLEQKGDYGKQASQVYAVAMAKDKKAGIDINDTDKSSFQKAEHAYFEQYHAKKNRWKDGKDVDGFLKTGLDVAGISLEEFNKALDDADVKAILTEWEASYNVATIQGVPAFIVNGKYLIYTKSISSLQDLESKIQELLKK